MLPYHSHPSLFLSSSKSFLCFAFPSFLPTYHSRNLSINPVSHLSTNRFNLSNTCYRICAALTPYVPFILYIHPPLSDPSLINDLPTWKFQLPTHSRKTRHAYTRPTSYRTSIHPVINPRGPSFRSRNRHRTFMLPYIIFDG